MHIFVPQHFSNLSIAQRSFEFSQLPCNLCSRAFLLQELLCGHPRHRNSIIRRIKNLETESTFLNGQITDLSQVASINVTPRIAFSGSGVTEVGREISLVLVGFDDIADAKGVYVVFEATSKCTCCCFPTYFGQCVAWNCQWEQTS